MDMTIVFAPFKVKIEFLLHYKNANYNIAIIYKYNLILYRFKKNR